MPEPREDDDIALGLDEEEGEDDREDGIEDPRDEDEPRHEDQ